MRRATPYALALSLAALLPGGPAARAQDPPRKETPADPNAVRGRLAWIRAAWRVQRDEFQRAVTELEAARTRAQGRGDFTTLFLLGTAYLRLGRFADGDPLLRDARTEFPDFPGFLLADALRLISTKPESADAALRQANDTVKLLDEFLAKLDSYPKDGAFAAELRYLGFVFRGRTKSRLPGQADAAVADLVRALEISRQNDRPPAADVVSLLSNLHMRLNQTGEAKRLALEAVAREPGEAGHYFNLGVILGTMFDVAGARRAYEAALARRPQFAEAHIKLAYFAAQSGELPELRRHIEAAAAIYEARARAGLPSDANAQADVESALGRYWSGVGDARAEAGDAAGATAAYRVAVSHLKEALAKQPGCVTALTLLIQAASRIGAPAAEIEELKRRLDQLNDPTAPHDGDVDAFRSTFC
jgi:tetratricopeptide (TPR) repeat protein